MADRFSFDEGGNNGAAGATGGASDGKPGSAGGEANATGPNSDTGKPDNGATGEAGQPASEPAPLGLTVDGKPRKRRPGGGRKPASGAAPGTTSAPNAGGANGLAVKNDRAKVRQNIAGLHAMAATLTRQPLLMLTDKEADALTGSLCDVCDYHGVDLMATGGAFGLYASLATCCYMIYVPRVVAIKAQRTAISEEPPKPGEARASAMNGAGKMDFTKDVQ